MIVNHHVAYPKIVHMEIKQKRKSIEVMIIPIPTENRKEKKIDKLTIQEELIEGLTIIIMMIN